MNKNTLYNHESGTICRFCTDSFQRNLKFPRKQAKSESHVKEQQMHSNSFRRFSFKAEDHQAAIRFRMFQIWQQKEMRLNKAAEI